MLPAAVNARNAESLRLQPSAELLEDYLAYLAATGRGNTSSTQAARVFLRRWPDPHAWTSEPLDVRLSLSPSASSLVMFLMTRRGLRPGWDWLVSRKLSSLWREINGTTIDADMSPL